MRLTRGPSAGFKARVTRGGFCRRLPRAASRGLDPGAARYHDTRAGW